MSEDLEDALVKCLQAKNEIFNASLIFRQISTDSKKVDFVYELLLENNLLPELMIDGKNNEKSDHLRKLGNQKYVKKAPAEAIEFYTQSIANANSNSREISLAYANRSAVLFEYKLYKECLEDINRAISNNYPEDLKPKIELRKSKALELISFQFVIKYTRPLPTIAEEDRNPLIQCASRSVEIKYTSEEGRFVVASRDIKPGEIIAIEKPLFYLLTGEFYMHCSECLQICYNLIPCSNCTQALYCSEKCRKEAYTKYHKYECVIILTLRKIGMIKLDIIALKIAFIIGDQLNDSSSTTFKESGIYRSDRYTEIHNLVTNRENRSVSDLFQKVASTAILYHYVKTYTSFFNEKSSKYKDNFKEMVLLHKQTSACNFHNIYMNLDPGHCNSSKPFGIGLIQNSIGSGAFSFLSMFNHSCSPNIMRLQHGINIIIVALERIKKGEQCLDNYGYHYALMSKQERQKVLKNQYKFDCKCDACKNDYPLYNALPQYGKESVTCKDFEIFAEKDLEKTNQLLERVIEDIDKIQYPKPNKNLADLQEMMKACAEFLVRTPF